MLILIRLEVYRKNTYIFLPPTFVALLIFFGKHDLHTSSYNGREWEQIGKHRYKNQIFLSNLHL